MTASARRLVPLLSVMCLLAPAAWSTPSIESLRKKVETPDAFSNVADGSVDRPAVSAGPVRGADAGRRRADVLTAPGTNGFRSEPFVVPPAPASTSLRSTLPAAAAAVLALSADGMIGLKSRGLAAAFGFGCLLVAAGLLLETKPEPAPAPEMGALAFQKALARHAPAAPPAAVAPVETPAVVAEKEPAAFFVGTLTPMPSWRAISRAEQGLIDLWDRSPEKSLGLASLEDWLSRKGGGRGVDVERLVAKLQRDA